MIAEVARELNVARQKVEEALRILRRAEYDGKMTPLFAAVLDAERAVNKALDEAQRIGSES